MILSPVQCGWRFRYTPAGFLCLLLAASITAHAADIPVPAPPPPPPPPFTWTGFYVGGNLGAAGAGGSLTDSLFGIDFTTGPNTTFIGGGQLGFNYQIAGFVVGVEGNFDWAVNHSPSGGVFTPVGTIQGTSNDTRITTVAARVGAGVDHFFLYAKGGGAWVGNNGFTVTNLTTGASITGLNNGTNSGWLAGFGVEWALTRNWTVKFEYDYLGLNNPTFTVPATAPFIPGDTFTSNNRNIQMAQLGFNFLFNFGC
jgi:outer membrane immunogenic protein